jgi:hypothetical protein
VRSRQPPLTLTPDTHFSYKASPYFTSLLIFTNTKDLNLSQLHSFGLRLRKEVQTSASILCSSKEGLLTYIICLQEAEARLRSKREQQFASILSVPTEERDRAERALVLDRAAAAIAAANAALEAANEGRRTWAAATRERPTAISKRSIFLDAESGGSSKEALIPLRTSEVLLTKKPGEGGRLSRGGGGSAGVSGGGAGKSLTLGEDATPGPDFWSWSPPEGGASGGRGLDTPMLKKADVPKAKPQLDTMVLDRPIGEIVANLEAPCNESEPCGHNRVFCRLLPESSHGSVTGCSSCSGKLNDINACLPIPWRAQSMGVMFCTVRYSWELFHGQDFRKRHRFDGGSFCLCFHLLLLYLLVPECLFYPSFSDGDSNARLRMWES